MGCCIGRRTAPKLKEYFTAVAELKETLRLEMASAALVGDVEKLDDLEAKEKTWFEDEGKPLLTESFKLHDKDNSGTLDKFEAGVFFSDLMGEQQDFQTAVTKQSIDNMVLLSIAQAKKSGTIPPAQLTEMETPEFKENVEKQVRDFIASKEEEAKQKVDDYMLHKVERDAAAFQLLDKNGDGTLDLNEVLAYMQFGSTKNMDLLISLGFITEEEKNAAGMLKIPQPKRKASSDQGACGQQ